VAIVDALAACGGLTPRGAAAAAGASASPRGERAAIAAGLAEVVHPGRLETVALAPPVVLDGAHNPHGARALGRYLTARRERPRLLVLAVSADKEVGGILAGVARSVEGVIATRYAQPRSLAAEALAGRAAVYHDIVEVAAALASAVERARRVAGPAGLVAVAGSLFAVAEVRPQFVPMAVDPLALSDPPPPGGG
jgi:dihydrofolate synthase/folylpolyglutamate synthase